MKCSEIMDALFIGRATFLEGKRRAGLSRAERDDPFLSRPTPRAQLGGESPRGEEVGNSRQPRGLVLRLLGDPEEGRREPGGG